LYEWHALVRAQLARVALEGELKRHSRQRELSGE
jgi:hypothetical protein